MNGWYYETRFAMKNYRDKTKSEKKQVHLSRKALKKIRIKNTKTIK